MIALSKLGTALTMVFAVSVVAILAQLFCVLRRWRRIRRQSLFVEEHSLYNPQMSSSIFSAGETSPASPSLPLYMEETTEMDNLLKWRGLYMYGLSRFLFTIVEEREGVDFENCSSSEKWTKKSKRLITNEHIGVVGVSSSLPVVAMTVDVDEATPFLYFQF